MVAGYLWLLVGFTFLTPDPSKRPKHDTAAALYDLAGDIGRVGIFAAISVVAYLVGAISQELFPAIANWFRRRTASFRTSHRGALPLRFTRAAADSQVPLQRFKGEMDRAATPQHLQTLYAALNGEWNKRADAAQTALHAELKLPALLLIGDKEQLFAQVDRLEAEAEFRLALVPPLTAFAVVAASKLGLIWLALLLAVGLLLSQGLQRRTDAQRVMGQAIDHGAVTSNAIESFEQWSKEFATRVKAALDEGATTPTKAD